MKRIKLVARNQGEWFEIQPNRWINDESWSEALKWMPAANCGLPRVDVERRFKPLIEVEFETED